jgi:hypothetical protein
MIRCRTDAKTLSAIVEASGLTAEPANAPDQFKLLNSGRNLASEVGPDLFRAAAKHLDRAAHLGAIPAWSALDRIDRSTDTYPSTMGISHLLVF